MVGQSIKDYRTHFNLTQEELANYLGVKKATIWSWESGRTEPTVGQCKKMAELFRVSMDDFLNGVVGSAIKQETPTWNIHFKDSNSDLDFLVEYATMPEDKRAMIMQYAKFIASQKGGNSE